jgi:glutamate dehydrogenase/leucine dehydrogenase
VNAIIFTAIMMRSQLKEYENRQPEVVFEWKDAQTEAEGWVVINSLRGGAAGGGTRMRKGLDKREVESLAKTMEIKFTVSGPAIGGAKSGINFDPTDPRKKGVLERWYTAVRPLLKTYYGTGGDLNVDEIHEVIPMTEGNGIWHPQEGVFNGHFQPTEAQKVKRIGQLRQGVVKVLDQPSLSPSIDRQYKVADMITGYGVAQSVVHYYNLWGGSVKDKKVIVQGWGNVGAAAAFYMASEGAKVVGIIDRTGGLINTEGFTFEKIRDLFLQRNGNLLQDADMISFEDINQQIWDLEADVFLPCAASRLVTQDQLDRMIKAGLQVIACGANVPFADSEIFFGPIAESADQRISLIPDFIANCGMARVFAYLMSDEIQEMNDISIFNDTSMTIQKALKEIHQTHPEATGITSQAFDIALKKLNA